MAGINHGEIRFGKGVVALGVAFLAVLAVDPARSAEVTGGSARPPGVSAAPVSPVTEGDPNGLLEGTAPEEASSPNAATGATTPFANPASPPRPPSAESMAAKSVTVTAKDCARLVNHRARADVAYAPGVDVHGNPVVSADLEDRSAWTAGIKDGFTMSLAINPFERAGRETPAGLSDPSVPIGTLRYDIGSGRMTLDGRPLTDPQTAALSDACHAHGF